MKKYKTHKHICKNCFYTAICGDSSCEIPKQFECVDCKEGNRLITDSQGNIGKLFNKPSTISNIRENA